MSDAKKIPTADVSVDPTEFYRKREKIYQRNPSGFFQTIRVVTIWITLGVYFLGPWLTWNGRQAVLFDLPDRKFYIFGMTFWPQDFILLSWLLIIAAFALFFFTVLAGRLWCGYTCPQTVWTTFFMWIEHVSEGDRHQRIRLDAQPWSIKKLIKKGTKHFFWILLSLFTAFTFVGYFAPVKELLINTAYLNLDPWAIFWLSFFTIATYMNAGWLREQVCIYMCPYARFQGVMFDKDTLQVTYDTKRGDPRGKRKKTADPKQENLGDCIDCKLCVQVCPTGIDIRNGLQYECIGCAACIDACDSIMDQMGYDRGLVRYSNEHAIQGEKSSILRPRLVAYAIILCIMILGFIGTLFSRVPLEVDIIRDRNQLYRTNIDGDIENVYTLKIINKTQELHSYRISLAGLEGLTLDTPETITALPGELVVVPTTAHISPGALKRPSTKIQFHVEALDDPSLQTEEESRFLGPIPKR
ncbi:cytochrome c oxidase accessory protein CcoG [Gammaproteobacteria bacterium 45_16_T64]|nr:cytochrome c oxidase accessory protein CcoG [Gammaproteobacteria bacterium 45_16_T64]